MRAKHLKMIETREICFEQTIVYWEMLSDSCTVYIYTFSYIFLREIKAINELKVND